MVSRTTFFGTDMSQVENAPIVLNRFLNIVKPETIIEIGTFKGGLSVLFSLYTIANNKRFVTYDIKDHIVNKEVFLKLSIDLRISDVFKESVISEITSLIRSAGVTVLFCDGGNKIREFNLFGKVLKQGDYILAHDYAKDKQFFNSQIKENVWNWCEITDSDVQQTCVENNLEKDFLDLELAAITCRVKK